MPYPPLTQLEGVRKADAGEGLIAALLAAGLMVGILDVDGGYVVGKQDDFVCVQFPLVLAGQGLCIYQPALYHADNECARACEGIQDVHVLVRQ